MTSANGASPLHGDYSKGMTASHSSRPDGRETKRLPHVVILGGGFAGLDAARALKRAPVHVTLVDRQNHHLFQPLLYQVATAALSSPDITAPVRKLLRRQDNATVLLGDVDHINLDKRCVAFEDGDTLDFDYLIVATGSTHTYFGHDEWGAYAPGLKTVADALLIRDRVLSAFEAAEREPDPDVRRELLTFVVVGGGPTGVELAGAIAEIAFQVIRRDFRNFDPQEACVFLVEAMDRLLLQYPADLSASAQRQLESVGVKVRLNAKVTGVDERGVTLADGRIDARTTLWGAGVQGSALGKSLGVELHRSGRVLVRPDLTVPGHDDVYVVGDLAYMVENDKPVPALAPSAKQMGKHAAKNIKRSLANEPTLPFHYKDRGTLATIGRSKAVGMVGKMKLRGFPAWFFWTFIHLMYLVGFKNRVLVLAEWAWSYFTFGRGARVIIDASDDMQRLRARAGGRLEVGARAVPPLPAPRVLEPASPPRRREGEQRPHP